MSRHRMMLYGGGNSRREAQMPYIMFTADKDAFVHFGPGDKSRTDQTTYSETFEYSYDGIAWTKWESLGYRHGLGPGYGNLYIRGVGNSNVCGFYDKYNFIFYESGSTLSDAKISCYGNIMSLLDYSLNTTSVPSYCFNYLFYNATQLVKAPVLPATELGDACYQAMFFGCEGLLEAPELPARTLAMTCYASMFDGCISLVKAPRLPAKELAQTCYSHMFYRCSSLTEAPALPATTLAYACYEWMFAGTGLTSMPELPAMTLTKQCYESMFRSCLKLVNAAALPAQTCTEACYRYMFYSCPSLERAPVLAATSLATNCYTGMFLNSGKVNYVKAMFVSFPDRDTDNYDTVVAQYMENWISNSQKSGTFVKNSKATWNESGIVPDGWTVETADA